MTKTEPSVYAHSLSSSSFWLPVLFLIGGLFLSGCGTTAPVVQSVNGPDTLETDESGTFEATINQEEAGTPLTYTWNFGDGSTASGLLADHTYSSTGQYSVRFEASNEGGSDTDTISVMVVPPPQPASITSINASPNPVDEGETVRFSSNVQGDSPIERRWPSGTERPRRVNPRLTSMRNRGSTPLAWKPPTMWEKIPAP